MPGGGGVGAVPEGEGSDLRQSVDRPRRNATTTKLLPTGVLRNVQENPSETPEIKATRTGFKTWFTGQQKVVRGAMPQPLKTSRSQVPKAVVTDGQIVNVYKKKSKIIEDYNNQTTGRQDISGSPFAISRISPEHQGLLTEGAAKTIEESDLIPKESNKVEEKLAGEKEATTTPVLEEIPAKDDKIDTNPPSSQSKIGNKGDQEKDVGVVVDKRRALSVDDYGKIESLEEMESSEVVESTVRAPENEKAKRKEMGLERRQAVIDHIFKMTTPEIEETAVAIAARKKQIEDEVAKLKKDNPIHVFKVGDREYGISKVPGGERQKTVAIIVASKGKYLGEGTSAKVSALNTYLVQAAGDASVEGIARIKWAIKEPKNDDMGRERDRQKKDIRHDAEISRRLDKGGPKVGIPPAARLVEYGGSVREIIPEYPIGGLDLKERNKEKGVGELEISSLVSQFVQGLENTHEAGVFLRDIKPENFRAIRNDKGELEIKFIDFGGAIVFDVEPDALFLNLNSIFAKGVTSGFIPYEMREKFKSAVTQFEERYNNVEQGGVEETEILKEMEVELTGLMKEWGKYATGLSLYEIITGESFGVYDKSTNEFLSVNESMKGIVQHGGAGYFRISDKEKARDVMYNKLTEKGTKPTDCKTILDLIFPSLPPLEVAS